MKRRFHGTNFQSFTEFCKPRRRNFEKERLAYLKTLSRNVIPRIIIYLWTLNRNMTTMTLILFEDWIYLVNHNFIRHERGRVREIPDQNLSKKVIVLGSSEGPPRISQQGPTTCSSHETNHAYILSQQT